MKTEIISIGDELLIGQVINTNSAWISKQLNQFGFDINRVITISDDASEIENALRESMQRVDIVLITGGLGPTKDDITKATLAKFFDTELVLNEQIIEDIKKLFGSRAITMNNLNKGQAYVPKDCKIFSNKCGTAPIMLFEKGNKVVVSMPGVPSEMQMAMVDDILPYLNNRFQTDAIFHYTINTYGIPESMLAEQISAWEDQLPAFIKLAYLPAAGKVRLRLTAHGKDEVSIKRQTLLEADKLIPLIGNNIMGYGEVDLYVSLSNLMKNRGLTMSTAESCTGGFISEQITKLAGASQFFKGSIVAYHNDVKMGVLGVSSESIANHGAVSKEVVESMALGVCKVLKTDFAVATSGIAGPDGGTVDKPVGTVWVAVAKANGEVVSELYQFGTIRDRNISRTSDSAIMLLMKMVG